MFPLIVSRPRSTTDRTHLPAPLQQYEAVTVDMCLIHHDSLSDVGVEFITARPSLAVPAVRHRRGGTRDVPAAADGKKEKVSKMAARTYLSAGKQ